MTANCFINLNAMPYDTPSLRQLLSRIVIESEQHKAFRSGHNLALNRRILQMHLRENRFCGEQKEVSLREITSAHAREKHEKLASRLIHSLSLSSVGQENFPLQSCDTILYQNENIVVVVYREKPSTSKYLR